MSQDELKKLRERTVRYKMIHEREHPLLYTKDGDLDFGWIILIVSCIVGLGMFVAEGFGFAKHISVAGWSWFGAFTSMAFIAGTAINRARLIAKSNVAGEVAKGIAESSVAPINPAVLPSKKDDERNDA